MAATKHLLTDSFGSPPVWSPDGQWIAFPHCQLDWESPIGFIRPDGTDFHRQRVGPPGYDVGADELLAWQPWPGTTPSRVLLDSIRHDTDTLRVRGHVRPGYPRRRVRVELLRPGVDGQLQAVDAASTLTASQDQTFAVALDRPAASTCVLRVRYTGDHDHLPSHTRRQLQC